MSDQLSFGRDTLADARRLVAAQYRAGVTCPCCGQLVKMYRRKVTGGMARALIWLVRSYERQQRFYHVTEFPDIGGRRGGNDYSKLTLWNLIEQSPNTSRPELPADYSGRWAPTTEGILFAHNELRVPKYALVLGGEVQEYNGELVHIEDCLPSYFNFWETWGRDADS